MRWICFLPIIISFSLTHTANALSTIEKESPSKSESAQAPKNKNQGLPANEEDALKKVMAQNERIEALINERTHTAHVMDGTVRYDIMTGTVLRGTLLNSIVSTNLESPILVRVDDRSPLPQGTLLSCMGTTKAKRVITACNLLILEKPKEEYGVSVSILSDDGSAGIRPDEIYSGKDLYVASTLVNSFARGMLEVGKDKLVTPYGELTKNTAKNKIIEGLIETSHEANEVMTDDMRDSTKEPKLFVNAGKSILIYFNARVQI